MTDNASDTSGNERSETPEEALRKDTAPESVFADETAACAAPGEEALAVEGLNIHIVEPNSAGTLFVAVAEPEDMPEGPVPYVAESPAEDWASGAPLEIPRYEELSDVAAVRLSGLGPALFFATNGVAVAAGDAVLAVMEEGLALGIVAGIMRMNPSHLDAGSGGKLSPLVRKATEEDLAVAGENTALAVEALAYCRDCIRQRDLDMKLVDVLILHDRGKMIFYFTAPARIDFRELVKDLVRRYRTRIELRQIGVRHETQMIGALGNCGMVCCCRRYLRKFEPVAIKMAKEQNVFLNPVKISGICGRLLCCLAYEQEHYDEFYRSCPKLGKKYHTDAGVVRILRASLFRESVTVLTENGEEVEYSLADWNTLNAHRPSAGQHIPKKPDQLPGKPVDDRPRKNERNGQSRPGRDDAPRQEAPQVALDVTAVVTEETLTVAEDEGGVFLAARDEVTIFSVTTTGEQPGGDDAPASDDCGSIFGLAPRRQEPAANGGPAPSLDTNGGQPDAGRKKRHHRRRKPRSDS